MRNFILEKLKISKPIVEEIPPTPLEQATDLLQFDRLLTVETFNKGVSYEGYAFVNFGAPWCSHCQRLLPIWNQLSKRFQPFEEIRILRVDCTASESLCRDYGVKAKRFDFAFSFQSNFVLDSGISNVNSISLWRIENRIQRFTRCRIFVQFCC